MNSGKTHAFFAWAAENAMVPSLTGERRPDYVAKADDDSFIMLGEMEKRLRVLGGVKVYWGCESSYHIRWTRAFADFPHSASPFQT